ncbi:MAG: hypothetical protein P0116_16305 [Candidatus Nitrosocosmicus sp.]|nr:hypothetical protein [Candidatus Nitrosocosmicus sp.]
MQYNAKQPNNKQLNSREYKIILKASNFTNEEKGRKKIIKALNDHFGKQNGKFTVDDKKTEKQKVWYLDTETHVLHEKYNFLLRIREEYDESDNIKGYDITFKNRNSDKTKAESYDLSGFQSLKIKFEEDIVTPFESKFSVSTKIKSKEYPNLNVYKNITEIFPNLNLNISENARLIRVNGVKVDEISYDLGRVEFHDAMDGHMQLGIWYDSNKSPIIAEFDIDVEAKDLTDSDNVEEFPQSKISQINDFYMAFQTEEGIVDLDTSKTKTQYVYDLGK